MPRFLVHLIGEGGGCDYTIACNQRLELLPEFLQTLEGAVNYVRYGHDQPRGEERGDGLAQSSQLVAYEGGEPSIVKATVYEVAGSQEIDVAEFYWGRQQRYREARDANQQAKDEAEYARLKQKLGK